MKHKTLIATLVAGLLIGGAASDTRADSIVIELTPTVTPIVGGRTFEYGVFLTAANQIKAGDYFTLYDFQGLVGTPVTTGLLAGPGWTFSSSLLGTTPAALTVIGLATDRGDLPNITYTYSGLTPINNDGPVTALFLGNFTATTTVTTGENPIETYVAQYTARNELLVVIDVTTNTGNTAVPFNVSGPFAPLPTAACGGLGLMGLLAGKRVRRQG